MARTSKTFKKCVDPCPHYLTLDDTHNLCVFCLGEESAHDVLKGEICVHCEFFSMKKLRSLVCPSFRGKRGSRLLSAIRDPPLPRHGGE